ncbi:hypothetical protein DITRI_Ditri09bG0109300 [Diplodiscus trichospermus]
MTCSSTSVIWKLLDSIWLRVSCWCKAKRPAIHECVLDIYRRPNSVKIPSNPKAIRVGGDWLRPQQAFVKFNVDGSSLGKPGQAGIGGILREHTAKWLIVFSTAIGIYDSNACSRAYCY